MLQLASMVLKTRLIKEPEIKESGLLSF